MSAALDLPTVADAVTKSAIAVLTLIAAGLVLVGLARAWRGRRQAQVVVADVVPATGLPAATSGLSTLLRQAVRQALQWQREDASKAVLETVDMDMTSGLLSVRGRVQVKSVAQGLQSTVQDSLTTLAAGIRALAQKEAEGLTAAIGSALPAQRGWVVRTFPLTGGRDGRDVGLSLEFGPLGRAADSVTTFWLAGDAEANEADRAQQVSALLHQLIEPAALWIATRLVAGQLAQTSLPAWRRFTPGVWSAREIGGLQMQLAGQLSLYAMRMQPGFDRGFAEQALDDLDKAEKRLPGYFRPHLTAANVHERLGHSYRREGQQQDAATEFLQAIKGYDRAEAALEEIDADQAERGAALVRVRVRRAKCRLLTNDVGQLVIAESELRELPSTGTEWRDLYNGACTFAVAAATFALVETDRNAYQQQAWRLLGLAFAGKGDRPWQLVLTDPDLEALDLELRRRYIDVLKRRSAQAGAEAQLPRDVLVEACLTEVGIGAEPPSDAEPR